MKRCSSQSSSQAHASCRVKTAFDLQKAGREPSSRSPKCCVLCSSPRYSAHIQTHALCSSACQASASPKQAVTQRALGSASDGLTSHATTARRDGISRGESTTQRSTILKDAERLIHAQVTGGPMRVESALISPASPRSSPPGSRSGRPSSPFGHPLPAKARRTQQTRDPRWQGSGREGVSMQAGPGSSPSHPRSATGGHHPDRC